MTPESTRYLEKAEKCLLNAATSLSVKLTNYVGRSAYLAAFHAAQAFVFERAGIVTKSHKGLHVQFARLVKGTAEFGDDITPFLQRGYSLKAVADYETGPDSEIAPERAASAIEDASIFVSVVRRALTPP